MYVKRKRASVSMVQSLLYMRRNKEQEGQRPDIDLMLQAMKDPEFIVHLDQELSEAKKRQYELDKSKAPLNLKLRPNSYGVYALAAAVHEISNFKGNVPDWMHIAVKKIVDLALQEKACMLPGNPADLDHGHLEVPKAFHSFLCHLSLE